MTPEDLRTLYTSLNAVEKENLRIAVFPPRLVGMAEKDLTSLILIAREDL